MQVCFYSTCITDSRAHYPKKAARGDGVNHALQISNMASEIYPELLRNVGEALVNEKTTLRKMVNHPERSDVTFVCKDGESVYASRFLVSSGCSVLESMLNNGMLESKLTKIRLPEISSQVLLSIMEYLYTAELVDYPPLTWRMGFEIISAAQFFILPNLEITIRWFLSTEATNAVESSEKHTMVEMLNVALEFHESWKGKETMLESFVDNIGDDWFDEGHPKILSVNAVDYIVSRRATSVNCPEPEGQEGLEAQSLEEYLLFRQIVLWQAYQKVSLSDALTIKQIQTALPYGKDPTVLWSLLSTVGAGASPLKITSGEITSMTSSPHDTISILKSLLQDEDSKKSLKQLLTHIKWTCIPLFLLVKVIEPLKLIPSSDLLEILTFHAFRRPMYFKSPKCNWKHGVAYTSTNGLICRRTKEVGFAVDANPMFRSYGMYEWHFKIKVGAHGFIELGFIHGCDNQPLRDDEWKFEGRLAEHPRSRTLLIIYDGKTYNVMNRKENGGKKWETLKIRRHCLTEIRFQLIPPMHTCRVRIGESFEEAWTDLPDAVYYPAISIGRSTLAKITLKLVRGFNYL